MFSILLSAFWFGHVFSVGQWLSIALVFAGIGVEALIKQAEKKSSSSKKKKLK